MADNSWIDADRGDVNSAQSRMMRTKVIVTVIIIVAAGVGVVLFHGVGSNATLYQSEGILIDYGEYNTLWTNITYTQDADTTSPLPMLKTACREHDLTYDLDATTQKPTGIDYIDSVSSQRYRISDSSTYSWNLWTVDNDGHMTKTDNYSINASSYKVVIWAYTAKDSKEGSTTPAIAVDATNTPIYGYSTAKRVVTLSPLTTETTCYVAGGVSTIVGTDSFSKYPQGIVTGKENGSIAVVGTYTSPSYESIINTNPDLVICDGSQNSQIEMAKKVRNSAINALVIYDATDIESIFNNIFIVSAAMNYNTAAKHIAEMKSAIYEIEEKINGHTKSTVMISLGANASPYVAASNTYANDILVQANGINSFGDMSGWPLINSESIPNRNPSMIYVIDADGYKSTEYQTMIDNISNTTWKDTDAYSNGKIYLFCEDFGNMAQIAGPRFVQFYEIMAKILNPDCFNDPGEESEVQEKLNSTRVIGSDYTQYLTITKYIG